MKIQIAISIDLKVIFLFYTFTKKGVILLNELREVKLNIQHFVYRGSVLKCTDYVFGVVIYVGKETKIMMNGNEFKFKKQKFR